MIRKFGSVDVPANEARRILLDIESWPQFLPNIRSARVVERSAKRIVADIRRAEFGSVRTTQLEFLPNPTGYIERQVSGRAKKWEAVWRIVESPSGRGSVVSCKLDVDLGLYDLLVPARMVQRTIDRTFETILRGLERHSHQAMVTAFSIRRPVARAESVHRLELFVTSTGLEIWLDHRKYVAHPSE